MHWVQIPLKINNNFKKKTIWGLPETKMKVTTWVLQELQPG